MVAYVDTGRAWVAAGEPISAPGDAIDVAERFVAAARAYHRRASFFGTEGILAAARSFRRFHLGEQPVWDPQQWATHLAAHRSLREQLRRARAKGVRVREVDAADFAKQPELPTQLRAVVQHWLASRPMPPMQFLVEVAPLAHLSHRRLFIAEQRGHVVGLVSLAPVATRGGWLFEHILRDPDAPNGTAELLIDAAMRALATDGVTWATLGLAPLAGAIPRWLRAVRTISRPLYNFDGLAAFKRKLRPQHWEPMYLAFPTAGSSASSLLDGLRAFAGGSLSRFALRTVLRGPRPLLTALEWLLVPWTLLLAIAPKHPWFPSRAIQWTWVVFDAALYALLRVARTRSFARAHPDRGIALVRVAALFVSMDALLTLWQAMVWNGQHVTSWRDALWVSIAVAGPLMTAPVLWGATRRLSRMRSVWHDASREMADAHPSIDGLA